MSSSNANVFINNGSASIQSPIHVATHHQGVLPTSDMIDLVGQPFAVIESDPGSFTHSFFLQLLTQLQACSRL